MRTIQSIAIFTLTALLFSCNTGPESAQQETVVDTADSSIQTTPQLLATTQLGEIVALAPQEKYCAATYLGKNDQSNFLLFETENGDALEMFSNPWNRNGCMMLDNNLDIQMRTQHRYELIYFKKAIPNHSDSVWSITGITPWGSVFHDFSRYVVNNTPAKFQVPESAYGQFLDDVTGDMLTIAKGNTTPMFFLSSIPKGKDASPLPLKSNYINTHLCAVQFPQGQQSILCHLDNDWLLLQPGEDRRVFRPR